MNTFDTFQIIPSIRRLGDLDYALRSRRDIILLTEADIANLKPLVARVHHSGKQAWVNLELLGGFGRDSTGIKLLKNYYPVDGVRSIDSGRLGMARRAGLFTVQRFLISDSRAYDTSLRLLQSNHTDAAEILPAMVALDILPDLRRTTAIPLLAGGFIRRAEEVTAIQSAGFEGLTVIKSALYN